MWNIWDIKFLKFASNSRKFLQSNEAVHTFNRHYPGTAEFQINRRIIKSSKLSVHAVSTKICFFNALPRALCFAWKKAAVTHIIVDVKLLDKGWYFAISVSVFGNVINSSTSSKCDARNVIRFKEQLNKKKLLQQPFHTIICRVDAQKRKTSG